MPVIQCSPPDGNPFGQREHTAEAGVEAVCDNPGLNQQLLSVVLTFGIALGLCLLGRSIVLRVLDRRIKDKLTFSHTLLHAIRFPSVLWCLAAALAITIRNAAPSPASRVLGHERHRSFHSLSASRW